MDVVVTNRNAEAFERRYDGTLYAFPPGERVQIPIQAATYLFGYGGTDVQRAKILVRNGWQRSSMKTAPDGPEAAAAILQNFVFNAAEPVQAPVKREKKVLASMQAKKAMATRGAQPAQDADVVEEIEDVGNPITPTPVASGSPGEPVSANLVLESEPPEHQPAAADTKSATVDSDSKPPRTPTGIAAMSPNVDAGGNSRAPRGTITIPGRSTPIAPSA